MRIGVGTELDVRKIHGLAIRLPKLGTESRPDGQSHKVKAIHFNTPRRLIEVGTAGVAQRTTGGLRFQRGAAPTGATSSQADPAACSTSGPQLGDAEFVRGGCPSSADAWFMNNGAGATGSPTTVSPAVNPDVWFPPLWPRGNPRSVGGGNRPRGVRHTAGTPGQ